MDMSYPDLLDKTNPSLGRAVLERMEEGVMVIDHLGEIVFVNHTFSQITGYPEGDVLGEKPPFIHREDPAAFLQALLQRVDGDGSVTIEEWTMKKSGEEIAVRAVIHSMEGLPLPRYLVLLTDVTQQLREGEKLRYLQNYDMLTRLPNRSLFIARLGEAVEVAAAVTGRRFAVLMVDLDGFNTINEAFGFHHGDDVLREAARRILLCVRRGDVVARTSGDEFGVIMDMVADGSNVTRVSERIAEALKKPFKVGEDEEAMVSATIGVSMFPSDGDSIQSLLRSVELQVALAKGKPAATVKRPDRAGGATRKKLLAGLARALEDDEFRLHYQPKFDLVTKRITGVEALLRWSHKTLGIVPPSAFIPLLEETGLISAVGQWVLETACRQHRIWKDAGWHVPVAINVSARQFREKNMIGMVEKVLTNTGVEPAGVELEITESLIMNDSENAIATLRALRKMGISLAMDDFGTGFSSLNYLKRFPLQTIKIDQSFVRDMVTNSEDLEIVRAIIAMGHSLQRKMVAEGVETEDQLKLLSVLGCDEIQGYLLAPPVETDKIGEMLRAAETKNAH